MASAPLRRILKTEMDQELFLSDHLECGHDLHARPTIATNAPKSRRCWKCVHEAADAMREAVRTVAEQVKLEQAQSRAEYDRGFLEAIMLIAVVGKDPLKLAARKCGTITPENEERLREIPGDPKVEEL